MEYTKLQKLTLQSDGLDALFLMLDSSYESTWLGLTFKQVVKSLMLYQLS